MISIIAAIGKNRELGKNNKLLWHIPEDLKRFRQLTLGHPIIMGRKTFESIGRPLPGRTNIVVTRDKEKVISSLARSHLARLDEVLVVGLLEEGVEKAFSCHSEFISESNSSQVEMPKQVRHDRGEVNKEVFIIGGGQIFEQALPFADKLYLTIVDATFEADTFFPDYSEFKKIVSEEKGETEEYKYTFLDLLRS